MKKLYALFLFLLCATVAQAQLVEVTFAVDMNGVDGFDPAEGVFVAGGFQSWTPADGALSDDDGDGIWTRTYDNMVPGNTENFKFGIGNDWGNNEGMDMTALTDDCSVSDSDGNINREYTVPADGGVVAFIYDSCDEAVLPSNTVMVTFAVNMNDVADFDPAMGVFVAGEFQSWTPGDGALTDDDGNGVWSRTYELDANQTIEYKFGIGNDWGNNESGQDCFVNDNRVLEIGMDDVLVNFMYNTCMESMLAVNVDDLATIADVSLFPNPTTHAATLQFTNVGGAAHDVIISNLQGQLIREYRNVRDNALTIERGELSAGLYFVTFRNQQGEMGTIRLMFQ